VLSHTSQPGILRPLGVRPNFLPKCNDEGDLPINRRKIPNWNPRTASTLSIAYNEALKRARDLGIEYGKGGVPLSDAIVDHIMENAKRGIFDPKTLAEGALLYLQRE
jgi:hypothetical protein